MFPFCKTRLKLNSIILTPIILIAILSFLLLAPNTTFAETLDSNQTTLITSGEVGAFDGEGSTK